MYGDFQCPYCTAAQSILRRVRDRLEGRLRFAFRHFPLTEVHPDAWRAAEAAEAAGAQGSFWEMHDALYANGGRFGEADLAALADRLGLDVERFRAELAAGVHTDRVQRDLEAGRAAGREPARRHSSSTGRFTPRASTPVRWSRHSRPIRQTATNLASPMPRVFALIAAALALFVAACGGSDNEAPKDPVGNVPSENGIRESVQSASNPTETDFPPSNGQDAAGARRHDDRRPDLALASSVFTTGGDSRMAFGMINKDGTPVYGPTAVYVAPTPGDPAEGPFLAPADVLLTDARYRSKQAATTEDPFVAVYGADVEFPKRGPYAVLAATKKSDGALTGATGNVTRLDRGRRSDPGRRREGPGRAHRHAGDGQGRRGDARHARAAERHARGRLRRGRRQGAGRAAVRDAAAVRVARVRPGGGHRAADEGQVRRPDEVHPPRGVGRQRHHQGPARAAASSSTCRRSRGCSWSTGPARSPRGSRVRSASQQFEEAVKSGL